MNFLLPSVPVEEGRPKLGKRCKLLLGIHHEGVAWNHSTGGALAYNDEPGGGRSCGRADKEKQMKESKNTCLLWAPVQPACQESPVEGFLSGG